jgi:hypothetical protein
MTNERATFEAEHERIEHRDRFLKQIMVAVSVKSATDVLLAQQGRPKEALPYLQGRSLSTGNTNSKAPPLILDPTTALAGPARRSPASGNAGPNSFATGSCTAMTDPQHLAGPLAHRLRTDAAEDPAQPGLSADSTSSPISASPEVSASSSVTSSGTADSAAQLAWLHRELDQQLSTYRRRRKRDKRKAFVLQMATVTLSATITVLLGLRTTGAAQQWLADIALALGAIITVLAAAEAFFTHRGLWILRTHTVRRLETLARHLDYQLSQLSGQPLEPTVVDRYATELDDILNEDYTRWQQLRATTPETRTPPEVSGNMPGSPAKSD